MALKDDLKESIDKGLHEVYPMSSEESFGEVSGVVLDRVWTTLEDVVGSAQEALFNQLNAARIELEASRRREQALRDIVNDLQGQLHSEESSEE